MSHPFYPKKSNQNIQLFRLAPAEFFLMLLLQMSSAAIAAIKTSNRSPYKKIKHPDIFITRRVVCTKDTVICLAP